MTQEQIAKLQELKQLLDAGILTQEEMQVEKAKVLGTQPSQPKEGNRIIEDSSKVIEEVSPVGTDVDDHLVYEAPQKTSQDTVFSKTSSAKQEINWKKILIPIAIVIGIGVIILVSKNISNKTTYHEEPETIVAVDSEVVATDGYAVETPMGETDYNEEASDDEFAYDPWIGGMTIEGGMYRTCDSRCGLNLKKVSKGLYSGDIVVMLGDAWSDHSESFEPNKGYLEGTVRAKVDGNVLTVVMDSYTSRTYGANTEDTNYFENSNISGQIFRITYNGGKYTAKVVGDMEGYFDAAYENGICKVTK